MSAEKVATLRYGNDEVTVLWRPSLCIHSGICARGLPGVFKPRERPWVVVDGASAEHSHVFERVDVLQGVLDTEHPEGGRGHHGQREKGH